MHTVQKPFGVFEVVRYAFSALVKNWKAFLLTDFVVSGAIYLLSLVGGQLAEYQSVEYDGLIRLFAFVAPIFVSTVVFFLFAWFYACYTKLSLMVLDSQATNIKDVLSSYRLIPSVVGASLIKQFFIFVLGMVAFVVLGIFSLGRGLSVLSLFLWIALASVLFLLVIWFYVRTSLATFFIVDKGSTATESLRLSYQLTRDRSLLIVGVWLVIGICATVLMLPLLLCIGALINGDSNAFVPRLLGVLFMSFYAVAVCGSWYLAQAYMYRKFAEHYALQRTDQNVSAK